MSPENARILEVSYAALQLADPSGYLSWPDLAFAIADVAKGPAEWDNWAYLGFAALSVIPLLTYAGEAGQSAILAKRAHDISKILVKKEKTRDMGLAINRAVRAAKNAKTPGEMKKLTKSVKETADKMRQAGKIRLADKLDNLAKTMKETTKAGTKFSKPRVAASLTGDVGMYALDKSREEESSEGQPGSHKPDPSLPAIPISVSNFKFYILPKTWRGTGVSWLTEDEKILSQRNWS